MQPAPSRSEVILRHTVMIEHHLRNATVNPLNEVGFLPGDSSILLESGAIFASAMCATASCDLQPMENAFEAAAGIEANPGLVVVDRLGHTRPVYRPLLIYCLTQTLKLLAPRLARTVLDRYRTIIGLWHEQITERMHRLQVSAPRGSWGAAAVVEFAWLGLARGIAGIDVHAASGDLRVDSFFDELARRQQQRNGLFLEARSSDNPETTWYHELLVLHAVGSWGAATSNRKLLAAVRKAAAHHQAETQPDHATNQPWGLFAFVLDAQTHPSADAMLHTVSAHLDGTTASPLALMLLADALYCLRAMSWSESDHD